MKYLRKFDSVSAMETAIESREVAFIGLAYDGDNAEVRITATPPGPETIPFYIEDVSGSDNTVQIKKTANGAPTLTIEKSTDGTTWETMGTTSTTAITATVPANGKLYLKCNTAAWATSADRNTISVTENCNVGGNIMSLLYGSSFTGNETTFPSGSTYTFYSLFKQLTHIIDSSNLMLPATTLANNCYANMFSGCTSLATAPALPATTLAGRCYTGMFKNCKLLTTVPELPATILAGWCYNEMFYGCTSLVTTPELPAATLADYCYTSMFGGCTSLTTVPTILPATTLANYCYQSMFYGCTSLTTAPALPATTLARTCYRDMFANCGSLTMAPGILPATTLDTECYYSMFYGCTSLATAPTLPATTLVSYCYLQMFQGCTNLNYIKCLATDISANNCTTNWLSGISSTGTFVKNASMTNWASGTSGIPENWTVEDAQ